MNPFDVVGEGLKAKTLTFYDRTSHFLLYIFKQKSLTAFDRFPVLTIVYCILFEKLILRNVCKSKYRNRNRNCISSLF